MIPENGGQPFPEPKEFVCKVCGNTKTGHISEYGYDYSYCTKCFTNYDDEGNIIPEGAEPEPEDYDPDDPDHERDREERA